MTIPRKEFLYFLVDKDNLSLYFERGLVKKSSVWKPLKHHPSGWRDIQISFGTNEKYFSPNLTYSIPLKFVNDGADILRNLLIKGKGYEEEVYVVILKWNRVIGEQGKYELEYKGRIDLSTAKDVVEEGVTVNTIEGGLATYLNANDSTTYEINCDETNPDFVRIKFDGITLTDKFTYSLYDFEAEGFTFTIPFTFLSNEGDNVGITHGDSSYEQMTGSDTDYVATSPNYFFTSVNAVSLRITGRIRFRHLNGAVILNDIYFLTTTGQRIYVTQNAKFTSAADSYVNIDTTINLASGEKLFFFYHTSNTLFPAQIQWKQSEFYVSFDTRNQTRDEDEVIGHNYQYEVFNQGPVNLPPGVTLLGVNDLNTDDTFYHSFQDYFVYSTGSETDVVKTSQHCALKPFAQTDVHITASIPYTSNNNASVSIFALTDIEPVAPLTDHTQNRYTLWEGNLDASGTIEIDQTITLKTNEKLFIWVQWNDTTDNFFIQDSILSMEFVTTTLAGVFAIEPLKLLKQLVSLMTQGKYTAESHFLTVHNNILLTCGDALRKTKRTVVPNYKMALSFQDFFQSYSALYDLGVKIVDNVLYLEPKTDLYADDAEIFDLGEVTDLSIEVATDKIISNIKCGYPDQTYDERSGKYEFNSIQEYKLPVTVVNKELDITSKFRGDGFGMEFIRGELSDKDTTDNSGDKQVFMVNCDTTALVSIATYTALKSLPENYNTSPRNLTFDSVSGQYFLAPDKSEFTYINSETKLFSIFINIYGRITGSPQDNCKFDVYVNNTLLRTKTIFAPQGTFRIDFNLTQNLNYNDKVKIVLTPTSNAFVTVTQAGMSLQTSSLTGQMYSLFRKTYTNISGVYDNTVFNVEEMTPKRQLLAHGASLRSLLYQMPNDKIIFQTSAKNKNLLTTFDGVTIYEGGDVTVGDLGDPLFLPYYGVFKAKVPFTFAQTVRKLGTGHIKVMYNGFDVYCLPIGDMTAKPGTDEPQQWKLLISPKTDLNTLLKLASNGLFIKDFNNNMLFISHLSPVQFVKYNKIIQQGYHHKEIFDDWVHQRFERFISQPAYFQKWQTSDIINLQFITASMGLLNIKVYDSNAVFVEQVDCTIVSNVSVQPPYTLQQASINLNPYNEGNYIFVLCADTVPVGISEWQNIQQDQPDTYLFEFHNSFNKLETYFDNYRPTFRCEGFLLPWEPDSTYTEFEDEPNDLELLNGVPFEKRKLVLGPGTGIPDWVAIKFNYIFLLDNVSLDGERITRNTESKFEKTESATGYPFYKYTLEVRKALNEFGVTIDDQDINSDLRRYTATYTLDASAFGQAEDALTIELDDE